MQNIHDLLGRKEIELEKLTKEVNAVRLTVQLLEEENRREASGNGRTAALTNKGGGAVGTHESPERVQTAKQRSIQESP